MVLEPAKENPPVVAGLGAADVAAGAGAPNENEGLGADADVADDEANATLANGLAFLGGVFSAPLDACDDVDVGIVVDGCAARVVEAKGLEGAAGFGEAAGAGEGADGARAVAPLALPNFRLDTLIILRRCITS